MTEKASSRSVHQSFRLHEQADSCGSSLAAGTASRGSVMQMGCSAQPSSLISLLVLLLHIVSFLDARSLCRLGQTCHQLQSVAGDHLSGVEEEAAGGLVSLGCSQSLVPSQSVRGCIV